MKINPWPIVITIFCVAAFALAASVVVVMVGKKVELVASDYYEQDLKHGERMIQEKRTRELGNRIGVRYQPDTQCIAVSFPDHTATGTITLYRPSDAAMDRTIRIDLGPDNQQLISGIDLAGGLWRVQCQWRQGEQDYYYSDAVMIP
jgi:hypothetical protein